MNETKFKVLMHCGQYVDANLLEQGIYGSLKPYIYSMDETIENIIGRAKIVKDTTGNSFISEKYIKNLKKCELVEVLITNTEVQKQFVPYQVCPLCNGAHDFCDVCKGKKIIPMKVL